MTFQRARTEEQMEQRKERLLVEAERLYETGGLSAVTFTNISKGTTITRQAIYRYYQTREEVLLNLLHHYYQKFIAHLERGLEEQVTLDKECYAGLLSEALLEHPMFLRLFAILYTNLEENVSLEHLIAFKATVFASFELFYQGLENLNPTIGQEQKELFAYQLMSFISSLYPVTHPTEKQRQAMVAISPDYQCLAIDKLCYTGILKLLG